MTVFVLRSHTISKYALKSQSLQRRREKNRTTHRRGIQSAFITQKLLESILYCIASLHCTRAICHKLATNSGIFSNKRRYRSQPIACELYMHIDTISCYITPYQRRKKLRWQWIYIWDQNTIIVQTPYQQDKTWKM